MKVRLAVIGTHPIPFRAQLFREIAKLQEVHLRSYFCCDWGLETYQDPEFKISVKWNVPLLDDYEHEFLPIARRPRRLSYWEVDNPGVGHALDQFDPDVVMVFGYAHRTNWRAVAWAASRRKPVLLMSDSSVLTPTPLWKRAIKQAVVRRFYSKISGSLYIGDSNRDYHLHYGLPRERLFRSVLPIDCARLLSAAGDRDETRLAVRQRLGIPMDAFVATFCGKYIARKRPLDIVRATLLLARSSPPICLLLVGEGPERAVIESYCRQHDLKNVVLTGFVDPQTVPQHYAASDVFISSASHDPHPIPVAEAALFGLPIIISDRVGCIGENDIARPDINAVVYPLGDVERLRDAIEMLYEDKDLHSRMSKASAQIAREQDVGVAARAIVDAALSLEKMGPR